ncbi:hypothetical protein GYMLUDRAFT_963843 [Collybiopsis luxurians FD-317 M1]|uniref:Uncharacterized protein n=1 Tax=Collybiopsis luxurians FD-317 M1 TaxID=944289 RepID=A0A0D0BDN7_9AGAR|nr:hypothetical protein GYMLUDRAFT_963843 [Collybiopsis luxurians FD-317 M1]
MEEGGENSEAVKDDETAGGQPENTIIPDPHTSSTTDDSGPVKLQHVIENKPSEGGISVLAVSFYIYFTPSSFFPSDPQRFQTRPRPIATRTRTKPNAPTLPSMPAATLSDLRLHSPSNIIGTPFTVDSSPYEYPFPAPNTRSSPSFEAFRPPLTPPSLLTNSLTLSGPTVALSTSPPFGPDARSFSPTHPKLRISDPPVPPGLVNRRMRWSLNLTRRDSSYSSQTSEGSSTGSSVRAAGESSRPTSLNGAIHNAPLPHARLSPVESSGRSSPKSGGAEGVSQ